AVQDALAHSHTNHTCENQPVISQALPSHQPVYYSASPRPEKKHVVQEQMQIYRSLHMEAENIQQQNEPVLGYALGQLHGIYILAENAQGLVMIDMHAAHERILYEKMKAELSQQNIAIQSLLVPITFLVSEREADAAENALDVFQQFGFCIERMSKDTLVVCEVPQLLTHGPIGQLIRDIIGDLLDSQKSLRAEVQINKL